MVDRKVDSVCPFCGVGCLHHLQRARTTKIVSVDGRDGPANHSRLCVKGRFGFDYAHHPQRLTKPLIRKPGVPKDSDDAPRPGDWSEVFREATWEEALDLAAGKLASLRDTHGTKSLAGFGSAKGSNEEAYLFQKLVRTGFGSNNVDHCTRLCHASSVAALLEGVGSGAVSNQVNDVEHAELIFVIGSNPTANHPVAATWMKNAAKRGAKIVLADPRRTDIGTPCLAHAAVQGRHRRRDAQRADPHGDRRGPGRRGLRPRPRQQLRGAARERARATAPRRWRRSAASRPRRCARSRAPSPPPRAR